MIDVLAASLPQRLPSLFTGIVDQVAET